MLHRTGDKTCSDCDSTEGDDTMAIMEFDLLLDVKTEEGTTDSIELDVEKKFQGDEEDEEFVIGRVQSSDVLNAEGGKRVLLSRSNGHDKYAIERWF